MKRGRGPRANPRKTREWQQRSAERAAENARDRSRDLPMLRPEAVDKKGRGELRAGQVGRKPPPEFPGPTRRVEFRGLLLTGRSCSVCLRAGRSKQGRQWHHWLGQQHIRAYVDAQRIRDEGEERALTRRLLHDDRNLSPVCFECHDAHENAANGPKFSAGDVPDSAREFAAELGGWFVVRLEHDYR